MNSLRRIKHGKICRHKVSDLYHGGSSNNRWLYTRLFDFAGLKMCSLYTLVLPFRVPVVGGTDSDSQGGRIIMADAARG
jgi:hypothetical protein